jgi:hypothetical protein
MKKINLLAVLFVIILALLSSCNQPGSSGSAVETADVYAVGYYINSDGYEVACYWKNGTRTDLVPDIAISSVGRAEAITVSDGDIYIAGYYLDSGGWWHACYWKNGTRHDMTTVEFPDEQLAAYDIYVDGSDVYIAGYLHDIDADPDEWSALYWKNAEAAEVLTNTTGIDYSMSLGIQVVNNDVYLAGVDAGHAAYWKNGFKTGLEDSGSSRAEAIYVGDTGRVYTTGKHVDGGATVACFWIDTYKSEYALGMITDASGTDIHVNSSGDIFVSGYVDTNACYWKNHTRTDLHTSSDSRAESIFLLNGDIYIGGWQYNGSSDTACYWKNGVRTDLHTTSKSQVLDIAAVL